MKAITLEYDAKNAIVKSILDSAIVAGARIVEPNNQTKRINPKKKSLTNVPANCVSLKDGFKEVREFVNDLF